MIGGAMLGGHEDTALGLKLKDRIGRDGPISVEEYMRECLLDPKHGYYRRATAIGAAGDFTTAPEISQIFGELIGIWAAVAWRAMGAPKTLNLVELGPGRGTLMRDALRAARIVPGFSDALRLSLVESNATLRKLQAETLADVSAPVEWYPDLPSVPIMSRNVAPGGTVVIANEFLDAIPVRQGIFVDGTWHERCVGLDSRRAFHYVPGAPLATGLVNIPGQAPKNGDIFEFRHELPSLVRNFTAWSDAAPMAALVVDYGHDQTSVGDTLQAVKLQHYISPFDHPGEADLTAHVDFAALRSVCLSAGLAFDGPMTQSQFLLGMGLAERAERLMASARPDQVGLIESGAQRIADPMGMGSRFKAVCIRSRTLPVLPPLVPEAASPARPTAGDRDGP